MKRPIPNDDRNHAPKVRIARPAGRSYQLRYRCPQTKKEVRISIGSRDEAEARRQKRELEARLLLGLATSTPKAKLIGPEMPWNDFREEYRTLHLVTLGEKSAIDAESRLDIAERIIRPKRLGDLASTDTLHRLQARLLAGAGGGEGSKEVRPRSPFTVKTYMAAVLAALNWAHFQGWLETAPKIRRVKVAKFRSMKGRPLTKAEFDQLLGAVEAIVGAEAAPSWKYLLRGLWESGLRLNELMHVSWDNPLVIMPVWREGRRPVLHIPHAMQKNATEESIPLLPWFEQLLLETPESERTEWIFKPMSLQLKRGREPSEERPEAEWVGKIISRIGEKAKVVVRPEDPKAKRLAKHASAHDLRRSCGERLLDAGVPPTIICRVLRHASWETTRRHYAPGDIQKEAEALQALLGPSTQRQRSTTSSSKDPEEQNDV